MISERIDDDDKMLVLSLHLAAPRDKIWRCFTEADLMAQWFAPKPWTTADVELDVRPGGSMRFVMQGPEGERFPNDGVYLEVVPGRKLVTTDVFESAWVPASEPFMTAILTFDDAEDGGTQYRAEVRHRTAEDRQKHENMGFHQGWTQCARQLEALAASLPESALPTEHQKLRTCLWFKEGGEKAAEFYVSLLPQSSIDKIYRPEPRVPPLVVEFTLAGAPYMVLNGGIEMQHSPAASISVLTQDQVETDRLWEDLTANGGRESQCGWVIDRFGVSWQIVPETLVRLINHQDRAAAGRAQQAMLTMKKINIAALENAFAGN